MADPTYVREEINANPIWELAFALSEIENDNAPIGWSRYIGTAEYLLAHYDISRKAAPPVATPATDAPRLLWLVQRARDIRRSGGDWSKAERDRSWEAWDQEAATALAAPQVTRKHVPSRPADQSEAQS